jgi:K+-sensing histidine kinase KdpD
LRYHPGVVAIGELRARVAGLAPGLTSRASIALGYLVGLAGVGLAGLVIALLGTGVHTGPMLFLVPVLFTATRWGIRPALVASVAAVVSYDLLVVRGASLFSPPRADELLTVLVLLFTASITGQLGGWVRRGSRQAREADILRSSDELKSALLHAVSHDLRTPLASIKASVTGLLASGARLDEADRRELLEAIDEETDRLTHLVANLLDLSRIEAGSLRAEKEWYDLGEVIGGVVERIRPQASGCDIRIGVPDDLPLVPLDYALVERVLANLIENAVRHGGRNGPIEIGVRTSPSAVRVEVSDRGPGIPPGEQERIFDRFYQSAGRRAGGVGLGLAIARGMVQAQGGQMWAGARPGGGAMFVFTLPLEPALATGEVGVV